MAMTMITAAIVPRATDDELEGREKCSHDLIRDLKKRNEMHIHKSSCEWGEMQKQLSNDDWGTDEVHHGGQREREKN